MSTTGAGNVEFEKEAKRCAACKYLRRRCAHDCVLAPYFPPLQPDRYACVHMVFGASNVMILLQSLPVQERAQAADTVVMEEWWRVQDPVYGSAGIISRLHEDILAVQCEVARTRAQLAIAGGTVHRQQAVALPPPWVRAHHVGTQMHGHDEQKAPLLDMDEFLGFDDF